MSNDYYIYTGALRVFNDFNYKTDQYTFSYDYNVIIMRLDMRN